MKLRWVAFALAALGGGAALGWLAQRDAGYVFISLGHHTVETSVWFALFALFALLAAAGLLWALARWAVTGRTRLAAWRRGRRQRQARHATTVGLTELLEGRWQTARLALEGAAHDADIPLVNYLAAARAAHAGGDDAGRDALCDQAAASTPDAAVGVALARARMLQERGAWRECRAAVDAALATAPRHAEALTLKLACARRLDDWQGVLATVAALGGVKGADKASLDAASRQAWQGRLAAAGTDAAQVKATWSAVPRKLRRSPALAIAHAEALAAASDGDAAVAALQAALKAGYHPGLIGCYGRVRSSQPREQLASAEHWLAEHPNDPALALALGRLSLAAGEREKAFKHLEASVAAAPTAECCAELGRLHLSAGEMERGIALIDRALAASATAEPPTPPSSGHNGDAER